MKRKELYLGIGAVVSIIILIIDNKTVQDACIEGINTCLLTVIPSLFPFIFLTNCVCSFLSGIKMPMLRPLGRLMGIPDGAESILINAFLGGFPAGALSVSRYAEAGLLSSNAVSRLLPICNNAGPAFIFGMVAGMFPAPHYGAILWFIQIMAVVVLSAVIKPLPCPAVRINEEDGFLEKILSKSIRSITMVCAWVILFHILLMLAQKWFLYLVPPFVRVIASGIMELSNGCLMLEDIKTVSIRFIVCSCLLSFGGLCVTMQTISVSKNISLRYYLLIRMLHCTLTAVFSSIYIYSHWMILVILIVLFFVFLYKRKIAIEIERFIMYNADTIIGGSSHAFSKKN